MCVCVSSRSQDLYLPGILILTAPSAFIFLIRFYPASCCFKFLRTSLINLFIYMNIYMLFCFFFIPYMPVGPVQTSNRLLNHWGVTNVCKSSSNLSQNRWRCALRQLQLEPRQLHLCSIFIAVLPALPMYSIRNTSSNLHPFLSQSRDQVIKEQFLLTWRRLTHLALATNPWMRAEPLPTAQSAPAFLLAMNA